MPQPLSPEQANALLDRLSTDDKYRALFSSDPGAALGQLRGQVHSYEGIPLVCTYHPAALLRNARWTRSFWDDLQLLRDVMDGA